MRRALALLVIATPGAAAADSITVFADPCWEEPGNAMCASQPGDEPDRAPAALRERLVPEHLWHLGASDGTWLTAARRALGASTDPFAPGPGFAGASALENRWTIDGMPVDSVADGGPELRVPLVWLRSIDVETGGLPASARTSTGAVIDGHLRGGKHDEDRDVRLSLWMGMRGSPRDRREVADAFDPFRFDARRGWDLTVMVTAGAELREAWQWNAWWFAGFGWEGRKTDGVRIARRLLDDDADGRYDRDEDGLLRHDTTSIGAADTVTGGMPFLLRMGFERGPHTATFTAIAALEILEPRRIAAAEAGAGDVSRSGFIGDLMADWATKIGERMELRLQAAWHHASRGEHGEVGKQIGTVYVPDPDDVPLDDAAAEACAHADDELAPCPISTGFYVRGGAGLLTNTSADRPTITAELSRRITAWGRHRAALGATMEDARLSVHRRFSGGSLERRLAEDIILTSQLVEVGDGVDTCDGQPCRFLGADTRIYRTRSIAAYLEDAWKPVPGVTFQGGLRWESMEIGEAIQLRDQLAPRFAFSADPTRRGRARVFASWGRYFPLLPAGMGPAVLGAADILTTIDSGLGSAQSIRSGDAIDVDPDLAPSVVDEAVMGAEWVIEDRVQVGVAYRARWTRRGIEDVGGELTNPADLRRDAREWLVWVGNEPRSWVHARLGWTRSRVTGSWAGPYDPDQGTTSYLSSYEGEANAHGLLPQDAPHRLFVEAVVRRPRASGWELRLGGRFQIASGAPVGVFAGARGEVPLLPRGSMGRVAPTTAVILHASLTKDDRLSFGLDVIDVFDRRAAAAVDQRWTVDDVRPIEGGEAADLLWLRTVDGDPARPNAGYGVATRYTPPFAARLSLTWTY